MNQEQVWDALAESWNNFRQKIYEKEILNLDWKKGKLLDIGCGNCKNLIPFKSLELYGIDFSSEMIKQSKKFSDKYNLKINLKKADMRKLPFKDNFFDYCLSLRSLHHINKKEGKRAIKEIYRVLKKEGQCFIAVWNKYSNFMFFKKEVYYSWKQKDKVYYRYYYLYNYFELKKLLKKNKFKIIKSGNFFDKNIKFLIQK
jgi:tRNA (uracil-5-)-methyltransferase TRM9